jgi:hypothetical protein
VDQATQMLAETVLLGFGMGASLFSVSRWAIGRVGIGVAALAAFAAAWVGFAAVVVIDGVSAWDVALAVLFAAIGPFAWDTRRVLAGRKSLIISRVFFLPGRLAYRLAGRPGLDRYLQRALPVPAADRRHTIEQIRVEYAATALGNARADPNLDAVIDALADHLADTLRPFDQTWQYQGSAEARYTTLTVLANRLIDSVSEPGQLPVVGYRGHSSFVLSMAAVCRLADRISPPNRRFTAVTPTSSS